MLVLAIDLDGTICFDGHNIDPCIIEALRQIPITVAIATARHPVNVTDCIPPDLLAEWDVIGANGALALKNGHLVHEKRLIAGRADALTRELDRIECAYLAYGADFILPGTQPHAMMRFVDQDVGTRLRLGGKGDLDMVVKILALPTEDEGRALRYCQNQPGLSVLPHSDGTFDVMAEGINKTAGLAALGHDLPVFAALGNDKNDTEMLSQARHSVAVGDDHAVHAVADLVLPTSPDLAADVARTIRGITNLLHTESTGKSI